MSTSLSTAASVSTHRWSGFAVCAFNTKFTNANRTIHASTCVNMEDTRAENIEDTTALLMEGFDGI